MGQALNIKILQGGQVIGQQQFDSDVHRTIKIGRLPSAQVKIEDPKAARIHAVIEFAGADVGIIDMGSAVGTLVNGTKIHKAKLNHGDQVLIGSTQLVIEVGAAAIAAAAPAAAQPMAPMGQPMAPMGQPMAPMGQPMAPMGQPMAPPAVIPQVAMQGAPAQPRFDPGVTADGPIRRITKERLRSAAVESRPHPALAPEEAMTRDNRVLELRLYWGEVLLGINHYDKPKKITIGESKKTDVFLSSEGLPVEAFPLVRYQNEDYMLTFTNQMEGEVEIKGELQPLQAVRSSSLARKDADFDGSYNVVLGEESRAIVHWGGATFALRFVTPPRPIPGSFFKNLDLQYLNLLLLSIFFHTAMLVTLRVYPYDTDSLREDLFNQPDRFAKLVLEPPKETQATQNMLEKLKKQVEQEKKELEKPEEKTKLKISTEVVQIKQKRPERTKAQAEAEVRQKFSRMFSGSGGGGMGSILGGGGGGSLSGTLSNVIGTTGSGSATAGLAGLGIRGGSLTGGGIGTSRGIAGIGTAGRLGGGGLAYGSGVKLGQRKDRSLIGFSTPVVMGALDKEVIQRVIDQHKNQIRFCYESELQRNQDLEGKVALKWVIAATGAVARVIVTDSTINNKNVENCIMSKIKTWVFPAPAGGGIVEVNYPFVFRATG